MLKYLVLTCLISAVIAQMKGRPLQLPSSLKPSESLPTVAEEACTTANGEVGECVPRQLCNTNISSTKGEGVINIKSQEKRCQSFKDVCCLVSDRREPVFVKPSSELQHGCGRWNKNGFGVGIIGNNDGYAKFGEFPWMVAILIIKPINDNVPDGQKLFVYVSGGTLIHPSVVLTAAHKMATTSNLIARAGDWDAQTSQEFYPHQDRDVTKLVVHKDFNKATFAYDIALLFLKSPMDLAPHVGVACLPRRQEGAIGGTSGCFASGWGKDKFGKEGRYQVILKKVEVSIVDRQKCQAELRKTHLGKVFQLHSTLMCARGEPGRDICEGDGGSPLVCPIQNEEYRYMQSGIVAWGIECGEKGVPQVYIDVSNLRDWIDNQVTVQGYDPKVYTF